MSKAKNEKTPWNPGFAGAYEGLSGVYDPLARLLSGGMIEAAKAVHTDFLGPGSRVLYPGVGTGSELPGAAAAGARITAFDRSRAMLDRAEARIPGPAVEFVHGDVFDHRPIHPYDALAAHFFLNLYPRATAVAALAHLLEMLRPGARVFVADFAPADHWPVAVLRYAYYLPIALVGRLLGMARLHGLHDYARFFGETGVELVGRRDIGPRRGPALFAVWIGRKG